METPSPASAPHTSAAAAATAAGAAATAAGGDTAAAMNGEGATPLCFSFCMEAEKQRERNGLRHNDFNRYRQYCSRRAARLRAALDLRCGKHRYQQKPLPSPIKDIRVLLLVQTCAERGWSLGMQLKEENAAAAVVNPRVRAHALRRFAKAAAHARLLERLCSSKVPLSSLSSSSKQQDSSSSKQQDSSSSRQHESSSSSRQQDSSSSRQQDSSNGRQPDGSSSRQQESLSKSEEKKEEKERREEEVILCDEKTRLDAHAYRLSLEAALLQEKEVWGAAAAVLQQLQQVYVHLRRVSSTREEEEELFKRLLKGIEPQLRLCAFHSGDVFAATAATAETEASKGVLAAAAAAPSPLQHLLSAAATAGRLPSPSSSASASAATALPAVTWRGQQLLLAADRPRAALAAAAASLRETLLFADAAGEQQLEELLRIAAAAATAANDQWKNTSPVEQKLLHFTEDEIEAVMVAYGELSSTFRRCVELLHAVLLRSPDQSAALVAAEAYCLDVIRCLDVERDLLLLLRFLLSMRRFEEEPSHAVLPQTSRSSRKQQQLLAVPRGETGVRHASLLLQALGRMMHEETVDEQQLSRMRHWQRIAKDARGVSLVAVHAALNKISEAYVLAATLCARTKPYACQSPPSSEGNFLHRRLEIFFYALQRQITPLAQRFEARALAAVINEEAAAAAARSESAAAAETAGVIEGEKQRNCFFQAPAGVTDKRKLPKVKKDAEPTSSALLATVAEYMLPPLEAIPCKPLLFDLAIAAYQAPEALTAAAAAAEKEEKSNEAAGGVRNFVKNLFWKK